MNLTHAHAMRLAAVASLWIDGEAPLHMGLPSAGCLLMRTDGMEPANAAEVVAAVRDELAEMLRESAPK